MQKILIYIPLLLLLSACSVYKIDIRQGNAITQKQMARLESGMTTQQVQALLGKPLIIDPFHPERWDYRYSLERQGELKHSYHLTLTFADGGLRNIIQEGTFPEDEEMLHEWERKTP